MTGPHALARDLEATLRLSGGAEAADLWRQLRDARVCGSCRVPGR